MRLSPETEKQIDALLQELTLEEKVAMCHANSKFTSAGVERLGIGDVFMMDGPHGVRSEPELHGWTCMNREEDKCTYLPPETALAAIREMVRQTGALVTDERGIAKRGTLVRHLVLPGHTRESIAVLDALAAIPDIHVSLMSQYTPVAEVAGYPELSRRVTAREYEKVVSHLLALDLTDGYVQDRASATTAYIPFF